MGNREDEGIQERNGCLRRDQGEKSVVNRM